MNLIEFNKILSQPNQIKKSQISGLNNIIEEYPYFQVAHFLHLKALKMRNSFKYNDYLKKTAAYTTDRSVLFDSITSDGLDIHPAPADLLIQTSEDPKETPLVEDTIIEAGLSEEQEEQKEQKEQDITPEETLKIGQPLQFKKDESFSFREWLQLSSFEPIDRSLPSPSDNPRSPRRLKLRRELQKTEVKWILLTNLLQPALR